MSGLKAVLETAILAVLMIAAAALMLTRSEWDEK